MTFREIQDLHRRSPGLFSDLSLVDFAKVGNVITRDDSFDQATNPFGNVVKGVSAGIDRFAENNLSGLAAPIDRGIEGLYNLFGVERQPDQVTGQGFVRQLINYAPMIAGAIPGPQQVVTAPLGLGLTAMLTAADAYEKSDSLANAAYAGGATLAAGPLARLTGKLGLAAAGKTAGALFEKTGGALGSRTFGQVAINGERAAITVGERAVDFVAGELGSEALFQVAEAAQSEQGFIDYFTDPGNLLSTAIEELPFTLADAPRAFSRTPEHLLEARARMFANSVQSGEQLQSGDSALKYVPKVELPKPAVAPVSKPRPAIEPSEEQALIDANYNLIDGELSRLQLEMESARRNVRSMNIPEERVAFLQEEVERRYNEYEVLLRAKRDAQNPQKELMGLNFDEFIANARKAARVDDQLGLQVTPDQQAKYQTVLQQKFASGNSNIANVEEAKALWIAAGGDVNVAPETFTSLVGQTAPKDIESFNDALLQRNLPGLEFRPPNEEEVKLAEQELNHVEDGVKTLQKVAVARADAELDPISDAQVSDALQVQLDLGEDLSEASQAAFDAVVNETNEELERKAAEKLADVSQVEPPVSQPGEGEAPTLVVELNEEVAAQTVEDASAAVEVAKEVSTTKKAKKEKKAKDPDTEVASKALEQELLNRYDELARLDKEGGFETQVPVREAFVATVKRDANEAATQLENWVGEISTKLSERKKVVAEKKTAQTKLEELATSLGIKARVNTNLKSSVRYIKDKRSWEFNPDEMQARFDEKVWTTPKWGPELPAETFTTFEDFVQYNMLRMKFMSDLIKEGNAKKPSLFAKDKRVQAKGTARALMAMNKVVPVNVLEASGGTHEIRIGENWKREAFEKRVNNLEQSLMVQANPGYIQGLGILPNETAIVRIGQTFFKVWRDPEPKRAGEIDVQLLQDNKAFEQHKDPKGVLPEAFKSITGESSTPFRGELTYYYITPLAETSRSVPEQLQVANAGRLAEAKEKVMAWLRDFRNISTEIKEEDTDTLKHQGRGKGTRMSPNDVPDPKNSIAVNINDSNWAANTRHLKKRFVRVREGAHSLQFPLNDKNNIIIKKGASGISWENTDRKGQTVVDGAGVRQFFSGLTIPQLEEKLRAHFGDETIGYISAAFDDAKLQDLQKEIDEREETKRKEKLPINAARRAAKEAADEKAEENSKETVKKVQYEKTAVSEALHAAAARLVGLEQHVQVGKSLDNRVQRRKVLRPEQQLKSAIKYGQAYLGLTPEEAHQVAAAAWADVDKENRSLGFRAALLSPKEILSDSEQAKIVEGLKELEVASVSEPEPTIQIRQPFSDQFTQLAERLGVRYGLRVAERDEFINALTRMREFFPHDGVRWGEIVQDSLVNGKQVAGLSQATQDGMRRIFLGALKGTGKMSTEDLTRLQSFVLAHELGHSVEQVFKKDGFNEKGMRSLEQLIEWSQSATFAERKEALQIASEMWLPESYRKLSDVQELIANVDDPNEFRANLMAVWAAGAMDGAKNTGFGLNFLPEPVRRAVRFLTQKVRKLAGALFNAVRLHKPSQVGDVKQRLESFRDFMENLNSAVIESDKTVADFTKLAGMGPEQILAGDLAVPDVNELFSFATLSDKQNRNILDSTARLASRLLEPMTQLTERIGLRGLGVALASHGEMMRAGQLRGLAPLVGGLTASGSIDKRHSPKYQEYMKVKRSENAKNNNAFNLFRRLNNRLEMIIEPDQIDSLLESYKLKDINERVGGGVGKEETKKRIKELEAARAAWQGLNNDEKQIVRNNLSNHVASVKEGQQMLLDARFESAQWDVATYLAKRLRKSNQSIPGSEVTHEEALHLARELVDGMESLLSQDPAVQQFGNEKRMLVRQRLTEAGDMQAYDNAVKMAAKLLDGKRQLAEFFAKRPWYAPERMVGRYHMTFKDAQGQTRRLVFQTKDGRVNAQKNLIKEGASYFAFRDVDKEHLYFELDPQWEGFVNQLDADRANFINSLDLDDEVKSTLINKFNTVNEFAALATQMEKIAMPDQRRKLKDERDYLDMVETHRIFLGLTSATAQNQVLNSRMAYELAHPSASEFPEQIQQFKTMVDNYRMPDSEVGRALVKGIFAYTMGLNFASHIMEFGQPIFTYHPQMVAEGLGVLEAHKWIASAGKAAHDAQIRMMKMGSSQELHDVWKSVVPGDEGVQLSELAKEAAQRGWISMAHASEVVEGNIDEALNVADLAHKGRVRSLGEKAAVPIKAFADVSAKVYSAFTHTNARIALVVGWRLAKRNADNRVAELQRAIEETPDVLRKNALFRELQLAKAKAEPWVKDPKNPARRILNPTLVEDAGRFNRVVTFSGGRANRNELMFSGKSPFYRTIGMAMNSLQSFTQGTLAMMARFVQHSYGAKQYPNLTPAQRANARKALISMFSTQMLAAGALGMPFVGAVIAALEANTDWEINKNARLALDSILEDDDGFLADVVMRGLVNAMTPVDLGSRFAIGGVLGTNAYDGFNPKAVFGPAFGIAENVLAGVKAAQAGDFGKSAEEFLPVAFKKLVSQVRNDFQIKDNEGRNLLEPTTGERIAIMLGFSPERVRRMQDLQRIQYRTREIARLHDKQFLDGLSEKVLQDPVSVREALLEREEMTDGQFNARQAVQRLAERVEEKKFPRDPAREVAARTAKTENALISAFRPLNQGANEYERLMLRSQVRQALGFGSAPSRHEIQQAQLIDTFMQRGYTRPEALKLAQRQMQSGF